MSRIQQHSAEEIRRALDDVLSRPELHEEPSMLDEIREWIFARLDMEGAGGVTEVLMWIAFGLVAIVVGYFAVLLVRAGWSGRTRRSKEGEAEHGPTVKERVRQLRAQALEAKRAGDLRMALRYSLFALVVGLGERGNLRYRAAWTYRELLGRGRPSQETAKLLAPLVHDLEAKEFGREPTTPADLERVEVLCRRYLGAFEEVAA